VIKLYRQDPESPAQLGYWEAWESDRRRVTLHQGVVGEIGLTATVRVPWFGSAEKVLAAESAGARAEGYAEVAAEALAQVVVQVPMSGVPGADLDLVEQLEGLCNEVLGWTGNGACDGHDIGAGTINIFNDVVLPEVAVDSLVDALGKDGPSEFQIMVRPAGSDETRVVWPV
jgi:hypothetical protein